MSHQKTDLCRSLFLNGLRRWVFIGGPDPAHALHELNSRRMLSSMSATETPALNAANVKAMLDRAAGDDGLDDAQRRRRQRVVDAARELFVQQGYRKTSLDEVARKAHVAKGTIYAYFANKAALLSGVVADDKRQMMHELAPLLDDSVDPRQRLKGWVHLYLQAALHNPLFHRMMAGDGELAMIMRELDDAMVVQAKAMQVAFMGQLVRSIAGDDVSDEVVAREARALLTMLFALTRGFDDPVGYGADNTDYVDMAYQLLAAGLDAKWPARGQGTQE